MTHDGKKNGQTPEDLPAWERRSPGAFVAHYLCHDALRHKLACFKPKGGVHYSVKGVGVRVSEDFKSNPRHDDWDGLPFPKVREKVFEVVERYLPEGTGDPRPVRSHVDEIRSNFRHVEHVVNAGLFHALGQLSGLQRARLVRQVTGSVVPDDIDVAVLHPYPSNFHCQDDGMLRSARDGSVVIFEIKVKRGNSRFDVAQLQKYRDLVRRWQEETPTSSRYLFAGRVDVVYVEPRDFDRTRGIPPETWSTPTSRRDGDEVRFTRTTFEDIALCAQSLPGLSGVNLHGVGTLLELVSDARPPPTSAGAGAG